MKGSFSSAGPHQAACNKQVLAILVLRVTHLWCRNPGSKAEREHPPAFPQLPEPSVVTNSKACKQTSLPQSPPSLLRLRSTLGLAEPLAEAGTWALHHPSAWGYCAHSLGPIACTDSCSEYKHRNYRKAMHCHPALPGAAVQPAPLQREGSLRRKTPTRQCGPPHCSAGGVPPTPSDRAG